MCMCGVRSPHILQAGRVRRRTVGDSHRGNMDVGCPTSWPWSRRRGWQVDMEILLVDFGVGSLELLKRLLGSSGYLHTAQ